MEVSNSNQGIGVSLSPSRITDYFNSSKVAIKDTKGVDKKKEHTVSTSSIYLTPESSPVSDLNIDDNETASQKKTDLIETFSQHTDTPNIQSNKPLDSISNSGDNSNSNSSRSSHVSSNLKDTQPEYKDYKNKPTEEVTPDFTKLQVKPVKPANGERKKSPAAISSSEMIMSSPSVPRPKIRRGAKSIPKVDTAPGEPVKPKSGRRKKKEPEVTQKNVITDFFPVRRSGRVTKSEIEKEKIHQLEQQLISKCEDGLKVVEFESKGRGVMATKDFLKGDFVVEYAGELIDVSTAKQREKDYAANTEIGCYMYYFNLGDKQYCVDATAESGLLGRLINHSRDGNCCTKALLLQDKPRLILVASKNIKSGEELCYDYGDRRKAALEAHPWLKS